VVGGLGANIGRLVRPFIERRRPSLILQFESTRLRAPGYARVYRKLTIPSGARFV
jgi:hypothetical protein